MDYNFASDFEKQLNNQYVFSMIVLLSALFGSLGIVETPERLRNLSKQWWFRLFTLLTIAYTATRQIEVSVISIVMLLLFLYLLRTPEERRDSEFI
jgi:uncharacterized membrane protein YhaH (DUF805 family)